MNKPFIFYSQKGLTPTLTVFLAHIDNIFIFLIIFIRNIIRISMDLQLNMKLYETALFFIVSNSVFCHS